MLSKLIPRPDTWRGTLLELLVVAAIAVGLAIGVQASIAKPYEIPSGSMEPTLDIGQRVLVNRLVYNFRDPRIGDIVVFHPPVGADSEQCGVQTSAHEACP